MNDDRTKASPPDDADLAALIGLAGARSPIAPDRATRVRDAVEAEWRDAVGRRRSGSRVAFLIAATIAAVAVTALLFVRAPSPVEPIAVGRLEVIQGTVSIDGRSSADAGSTLLTGREIETPAGSRAAIRLLSGASLRLDSGTRILFDDAARVQLLAGAVYLDSPEELNGSFEVAAGDVLVREIGTRFEVRRNADGVSVRVRDGSVELAGRDVSPIRQGEQVVVHSNGSLDRSSIEPWGADWLWTAAVAPPFEIEGQAIEEFLAWFSRETGIAVQAGNVEREFLSSTRLHGSIEGLSPLEALEAVLPATGLDWTSEPGRIVLER